MPPKTVIRDGTRKDRPWSVHGPQSLEGHAHRLDSYNAVTEETLELERIEQWHQTLPYPATLEQLYTHAA